MSQDGWRSEPWLAHVGAVLGAAGLRTSAGRTAVVELLAREHCLVSAQDVVAQLRGEVSTATVYRALETLHDHGLVRRFDSADGPGRFERAEPTGVHHHHVVFDDGSVEPFDDAALEEAIHALGDRLGVDVTGHDVTLHARRG